MDQAVAKLNQVSTHTQLMKNKKWANVQSKCKDISIRDTAQGNSKI